MLKFLRVNKKFARISLVVLIASFLAGIIVPVILGLIPKRAAETLSLEDYIQTEILAMEEELLSYNEAIEENPEDGDAWIHKANLEYNLGSLLYEVQRLEEGLDYFKEAEVSYQKALDYNPEDTDALTKLAMVGLYTGENELAEVNFKKVLDKDPEHIFARVNYGIFLYDIKSDNEGAIEQWEAALNSNPENQQVKEEIESLIAFVKEQESKKL
jgi:tetratricopeptide (TPR) repeat protein